MQTSLEMNAPLRFSSWAASGWLRSIGRPACKECMESYMARGGEQGVQFRREAEGKFTGRKCCIFCHELAFCLDVHRPQSSSTQQERSTGLSWLSLLGGIYLQPAVGFQGTSPHSPFALGCRFRLAAPSPVLVQDAGGCPRS